MAQGKHFKEIIKNIKYYPPMYYFIKKTGELAKRKNVPSKKSDLERKNGIYLRVVLGKRKDKAFFVYRNQLKDVEESTLLTPFEIECLRRAHNNPDEWKVVCATIKASRGNNYPKDWFSVLRKEKIERDANDKKESGGLNILSMMSGLFKSLGQQPMAEEQQGSSIPTIIVLETDPDTFGKKKETKGKPLEKMHDLIKFHSIVDGTDDILENVDFLTRYDFSTHKSIAIVPSISENDIVGFSAPFLNLRLPAKRSFTNTLDLLNWIVVKAGENKDSLPSGTTLEDLGIQHVKKTGPGSFMVEFIS